MGKSDINIELVNIEKSYLVDQENQFGVLKGLNFSCDEDEIISIVGPNGSGKTTLLRLLSGSLRPSSGKIILNKRNGEKISTSYVSQNYSETLLPWLSVIDNIAFPLYIGRKKNRIEARQQAISHFQEFSQQIDISKPIYQLSGGQQQIVSLMRSTIIEPDLWLLDEPFSALDQSNRWAMTSYLEKIWLSRKIPTFIATHDVDEAILIADKIILLSKKQLNIVRVLKNDQKRPRKKAGLTSKGHIEIRNEIINFFSEEEEHDKRTN